MSKRKILLAIVGIALIFVLWNWCALLLASRLIRLSPCEGSFIADSTPTIAAVLSWSPCTQLKSARVFLDGEDVSDFLSLSRGGFSLSPGCSLFEGRHDVRAELIYALLFPHRVELEWSFEVDTTPPRVTFPGGNNVIGVPRSWIDYLAGTTEPHSKVEVIFNGRALPSPEVDSSGNFFLSLYALSNENELKIIATDLAGNKSNLIIPVVIDTSPPKIRMYTPADGTTVHAEQPEIMVEFEEADSEIVSITLYVDGSPVDYDYNLHNQVLSHKFSFLPDGKHFVNLKAVDAAENVLKREWSFILDSTRILIEISQRRLHLFREGSLIKVYPIAVGQEFSFPTPRGSFKIINKRKNPTWYNPRKPWSRDMPPFIPPGPGNPLGTRALDLDASGIRIHGTYVSSSIGRAVSHGCIRMYLRDAEDLFDRVSVGTPVDIVH
ncbi:MAG: L,D-transpeptidase family protein [Actinomycetota bacterium]|nr:L,D-transpeptidase family protein [Actinomycetota bacterium]